MTLPVILVNQFGQIITNGGKIVANVDPDDCGCCEPPKACLNCRLGEYTAKTAKLVLSGSLNNSCGSCGLLDGTYLASYVDSSTAGDNYVCTWIYLYPTPPAPFRACSSLTEIYLQLQIIWNSSTDETTLSVNFYADSIPVWTSAPIPGRVDCNSLGEIVCVLTFQNALPGSHCLFGGSTVTVSLV